MQSRHVWGPFWAGAPPAASPLLRLLRILKFKFGGSRSSPESPRIMGTTITLSLPWEAWGTRGVCGGISNSALEFAHTDYGCIRLLL